MKMADAPVVHIGENSPEEVAFKLLRVVARLEDKNLSPFQGGKSEPDRAWVLNTYAECLNATKGYRDYTKGK